MDFILVDEVIHVDERAMGITQAGFGRPTPRDPIVDCKVDCLGTIKTVIKTSMVGTRPCNDKLTSLLDDSVDFDVESAT